VCREFVVGTASGHCPRCGFVPPTAPVVHAGEPSRFWPRFVVGCAVAGLVALAIQLAAL
jgi:hypothetical protein